MYEFCVHDSAVPLNKNATVYSYEDVQRDDRQEYQNSSRLHAWRDIKWIEERKNFHDDNKVKRNNTERALEGKKNFMSMYTLREGIFLALIGDIKKNYGTI